MSAFVFSIFFLYISTLLLNADLGFSYDYQYYIIYFEQVQKLSFHEIASISNGMYVPLDYSSGIEIGFVYFIKLVSLFFDNVNLIYLLSVLLSLSIKIYVFREFKVGTLWTVLMLTLSVILLEGNALRSGISLSFYLLGLKSIKNGKESSSIVFFSLSVLFHIQATFFILVYMSLSFMPLRLINTRSKLFTISVLFLISGFLLNYLIGFISLSKVMFYSSQGSTSGGVNVLSFLSGVFLLMYVLVSSELVSNHKQKILFLSVIPAYSIYLLATNVSVVGDRLWQWGLIILILASYSNSKKRLGKVLHVRSYSVVMIVLLVVFLVNILYRYPLTNIMSPLIGYIDLSR